jgi:hypothetical protein
MAQTWQSLRGNIFGVFYVMTEQSSTGSRDSTWAVIRCTVTFLVDTGQVLKALFLKEYGWTPQVVQLMNKFDILSFITNVVSRLSEILLLT